MTLITTGAGAELSIVSKKRRAFLHEFFGDVELDIFEVGALDNPTFLPAEGVKFADYFTQEESQKRHRNAKNHDANRIVPVDYVLRDTSMASAVKERCDLIIANHVLEHLANPIDWLSDASKCASYLLLCLPDRRYTFDYYKPETDAADWITWFRQGLEKPSFEHVLRHLYYHIQYRHEQAWSNQKPPKFEPRMQMSEALERAVDLESVYTDVHCSVFTFDSFLALFGDLKDTDLMPWQIVAQADVAMGDNEFRILLKNSSTGLR